MEPTEALTDLVAAGGGIGPAATHELRELLAHDGARLAFECLCHHIAVTEASISPGYFTWLQDCGRALRAPAGIWGSVPGSVVNSGP